MAIPRLVRLALRAYPREFRERRGRSLALTLLADCRTPEGHPARWKLLTGVVELIGSGLSERLSRWRAGRRAPRKGWRHSVDALRADLHQTRRSLMRRPGFVAAVIATLGLGMAVNVTLFALVNTILIRELPYRQPSNLAFMWTNLDWIGVPRAWVAGPHIDRLRREATTVEDIVALRISTERLLGGAEPQLISAGWSEAHLFDVLGVRPALGRLPTPDDEVRHVVVLGHALWQQHFGADPLIVGEQVEIGSTMHEVIGVLREDFRFRIHTSLSDAAAIEAWIPGRWPLAEMNQGQFSFAALVRAGDEFGLDSAQAQLDVIGAELDRDVFGSRGFGWTLVGVQDDLVASARPALVLLVTSAGFLLLVVCANVSAMMLARTIDRHREFALRSALGAGRGRTARLVLIEALVLAGAAGAVGLGLATLVTRVLAANSTLPLPRLAELSIDWRVAVFTLLIALGAGALLALLPAWRATGARTASALRAGGRGSSNQAGRVRGSLVVTQVAIAVTLVTASGWLYKSYDAIRRQDPGFATDGALLADIVLDDEAEERAVQFFGTLTEELAALPGVSSVSGVSNPPLAGGADQVGVRPLDGPLSRAGTATDESAVTSDWLRSTPGYLETMGIRLIRGRDFTAADTAGAQLVAIVDERFADSAWPGDTALGRQVTIGGSDPVTVVGVIQQPRLYTMEADDRAQIYVPFAQDPTGQLTMVLRVTGDPAGTAGALRAAVRRLDPRQPVADVTVISDTVRASLGDRRLQLTFLGGLAGAALMLSLLGVYSALSALVFERTREIGIRVALGATMTSVRWLVLRRTLLLVGAGLALGLAGAAIASHSLAHLLFEVDPGDPATLVVTASLVTTAGLLASQLPIRRAAAIDPVIALRAE